MIELRAISFAYDDAVVLDDVDLTVGDTVDRAGGHVDEAGDTGLLGQRGQVHRPLVVDLVGDGRRKLTQRVVGQLSHVDDGVHPGQVLRAPDHP